MPRIGPAHRISPAPLAVGVRQRLAGVRIGGPQPHPLLRCPPRHRIPVQMLPPIPVHVRAAGVQLGATNFAESNCKQFTNKINGLRRIFVQLLRETSVTPAVSPHTAGSQDRFSPWPPRSACSMHDGSGPRCVYGVEASRQRRPRRSAPAASAPRCSRAGGGPTRPGSQVARGTGPAAPPRRAPPACLGLVADAASQGRSAGGQGPGRPPQKSRGTPETPSADTPENLLIHCPTKTLRLATGILIRESKIIYQYWDCGLGKP